MPVVPIRRIAMLSVHTCPLAVLGGKKTGGMNVYVRELSREFGRRGLQVDVYTRSQDSCVGQVDHSLGHHVRVIHIPTGPEQPLEPDQIYAYLPEFVDNVGQFATRDGIRYDLIYSHYWLSAWVAHELRDAWHIPVVQMFHTLGLMKDRIAFKAAYHPQDIRSTVEADAMCWADRIIAATPAEQNQMLWLYRARRRAIEIIPPGVDLASFRPLPPDVAKRAIGMSPEQRILLFVGRIERLKGVDTIFEALSLLKESTPGLLNNLSLAVIGGDPEGPAPDNAEMERLKGLRVDMGLEDLVVFLGAKDQNTLNYYYAASEALIMPSDYESFGMVALEAMASGTPVIASEVGGLAFLVRDGINGFHVPVREPAALAEKIRVVLQEPAIRRQLGQNAIQIAQDYAWPKIADQLLRTFAATIPPQQISVR